MGLQTDKTSVRNRKSKSVTLPCCFNSGKTKQKKIKQKPRNLISLKGLLYFKTIEVPKIFMSVNYKKEKNLPDICFLKSPPLAIRPVLKMDHLAGCDLIRRRNTSL